jgi:hypothetical protein
MQSKQRAMEKTIRSLAQKDPNIAASFAILRQSVESEYYGKLPDNSVDITCHLEYPSSGEVANGSVFKCILVQI